MANVRVTGPQLVGRATWPILEENCGWLALYQELLSVCDSVYFFFFLNKTNQKQNKQKQPKSNNNKR